MSHYKSSWGKWSSWCSERNVDPFRCTLNYTYLFEQRYSYNSIAGYRSAISSFHDLIKVAHEEITLEKLIFLF